MSSTDRDREQVAARGDHACSAPRLVVGDDGSAAADVVWSWVNNHRWHGWRISVLTAGAPKVGPPVGAERATLHPWDPPHPRQFLTADEAEDDDLLAEAITRTIGRGGVVSMPAVSVDRTFVLLMTLARLETEGRIPSVPAYVDSPMALRALEDYTTAIKEHDPQLRPEVTMASTQYRPARLELASSVMESEKLNRPGKSCIIVSASGARALAARLADDLGWNAVVPRCLERVRL